MRGFSWRFIRLWQRNGDVFLRLWHTEVTGFVVEPLVVLVAMGIGLGAYIGMVDGQDYISFMAPGVIAGYAMFTATFECTFGTYIRLDHQKTFDAVTATPLNAEDVIAGEIFWGATRACLTGTVILIVAALFGMAVTPWVLLIPPLVFAEGLMFSAMGVTCAAIVPSIHTLNHYFSLVISPMFFFAGVFFPLDSFPELVQRLSWLAPLTAATNLTRALFTGSFGPDNLLAVVIIVVLTLVFFALALVLMRRRLVA